MITSCNIENINGHEYDYILGLQKRNRKLADHLPNKILKRPDGATQEFGYCDLSKQLQTKYSGKVRIIACYNPDVAKKTKATGERSLLAEYSGSIRSYKEGRTAGRTVFHSD